ncbi:Metallo-dependent phosphatase-like protein [Obelidium mucronatum]|nr:Metallo-dependent phosphatase-like protein [Obelidium mucronatum]
MEPFKFKLFSDIHLELGGRHALHLEPYKSLLDPCGADYLILAGDCGKPGSPGYEEFLMLAAPVFKAIFLIPGNHEYYNLTKEDVDRDTTIWIDSLNLLLGHTKKLFLLGHNQDFFVAESNLRILGCTLWSHIPDGEPRAAIGKYLNDFRMIGTRKGRTEAETPRRITVDDYNAWHKSDVAWLEDQINNAKERGERILVITHHPPTFEQTSAPEFRSDDNVMKFAFASDLERLFGEMVVCWCYGHTHFTNDMVIKGTRVVSNQPGYLFERGNNKGWFPKKVITL